MKQLIHKPLLFISVITSVLFVDTTNLYGQEVLQKTELKKIASQQRAEFQQHKQAALEIANAEGYLIRGTLQNGTVVELQRFERGIPIYLTTYNLEGADLIKSSELWENGAAGLNLSGQGETLGIWDGGAVRATHQEFSDRIIQADSVTTISEHATHVAGTMIAEGVDANAKGMSPKANLNAYDWNNDNSEMAEAAAGGLTVSQHSYGHIIGWAWGNFSGYEGWHWFGDETMNDSRDFFFGHYDHWANQWDNIAYNAPHYLMVKSAGNDRGEGPENQPITHYVRENGEWVASDKVRELDGGSDGYKSIGRVGTAKNILTVGAVDAAANMASFSGWGPTHDGRIKPDVVAKGVNVYSSVSSSDDNYGSFNGTSMSGPMVSGSVGLLNEHYKNVTAADQSLWASTMKALIIHAANDTINGTTPGPDYRHGWGLMDTRRTAELISEDTARDGYTSINELVLNEGDELIYEIQASGEEPLKVTIAWSDVPGPYNYDNPDTTKAVLVNDLDMRIKFQDVQEHAPYILDPSSPTSAANTGDNFRDNVEVIHINETKKDSIYHLHLSHKATLENGSQPFSLIITGGALNSQQLRSKPSNLVAELNNYTGEVTLSWQFPFSEIDDQTAFQEFNIYRNDQLISSTDSTYFSEILPDTGEYVYKVTALYESEESYPAGPIQLLWDDSIFIDVWPGDANNDGDVDASDVLPIGIYYSEERGAENNPGNAWELHQREPWEADGQSPKRIFADTNGDGKIDARDVLVIGLNYSKTHEVNESLLADNDTGMQEAEDLLWIEVLNDTPEEGVLELELKWSPDVPLQGIAFDVLMEDQKELAGYELDHTNSFLGKDLLVFDQYLKAENKLDLALSNKESSVYASDKAIAKLNLSHEWISGTELTMRFENIVTAHQGAAKDVTLNYVIGSGSLSTSTENEKPVRNELGDNYPNPFNPTTSIEYSISKPGLVRLTVYTITGQQVKTLIDKRQMAGTYNVVFDAGSLSSGVYLYKIETANFSKVKKLTLIK